MRRMSLWILLFCLCAPATLAAQACLGSHASPGSMSVAGTVGAASSGDVTYGAATAVNMPGPMFAAAGYARSDVDVSGLDRNELALAFGAEARNAHGTSLCVHARAGHGWISGLPEGASVRGEAIWGGGSVGRSFGQDVLVTPYGFVGVATVDASSSVLGLAIDEAESVGARFAAGIGIGSPTLQARPHVTYITLEGADLVFGVDVLATF